MTNLGNIYNVELVTHVPDEIRRRYETVIITNRERWVTEYTNNFALRLSDINMHLDNLLQGLRELDCRSEQQTYFNTYGW